MAVREPGRGLPGSLSLPWSGTSVLTSVWLFAFCWLIVGDLEGLLTQARTTRHGLRASSPAADQLVLGDAEPGEKAVVLDRVG